MDLPFRLLNVFAIEDDPFSGNPLCVFPEAAGLDEPAMQAWARQFNLSESAFVTSAVTGEAAGEAQVRIFTPGHEMPFAGHPTLGTAEVVADMAGDVDEVHLSMPAGRIPVVRTADGWRLTARPATLREVGSSAADLALALGVQEASVVRQDASWVDAGVEQLVVHIDSAEAVRACAPVASGMAAHMTSPGRPPHVYAWAWTGPGSVEARLFYTEGQSVLEDPATGSACANLGGWLAAQGRRDVSVEVSQGAAVGRPSRLLLDVDAHGRVHVGGRVDAVGQGVAVHGGPGRSRSGLSEKGR
ncbi:PhzF family phenazine biosynthesis protein [Terrabacter sp. NPDC080008]|uniref:PhzF family phenazine biosynthesis protein n=1 Tax=Terrabacter sp. NPDC080008 TaxID=3155176 RepID=UPI00344E29A5